MSRQIGLDDSRAIAHVGQRADDIDAHVVHGHGAKGGAYARLASSDRALRVYSPHGGSLHYSWRSPAGIFYLAAERALMRRTDLFLFESAYGRDMFRTKIGSPAAPMWTVHNGVAELEFTSVAHGAAAADLVFVGELRALKGVDVLIQGLARLGRDGRNVTA